MSRPTNCQSYQERDGTHYCGLCGLRWDDDSIDPPDCSPVRDNPKWPTGPDRTFKPPVDREEYRKHIEGEWIPERTQAEQDEINSSGMKRLRESMKDD